MTKIANAIDYDMLKVGHRDAFSDTMLSTTFDLSLRLETLRP